LESKQDAVTHSHELRCLWFQLVCLVAFCLAIYAILSRGHRKHLAHRVSAARGSFPKCGQVHEPYFQPRKTCFQHVPTACSTRSNGFLKHIAKMCDHIQCIFSEPMSQHSPSCKIKGNEKHRIPVQISTKHLKELKSSKIQYLRRSQVIQIEHLARARQET
jgi:hypothetical protein